MKFSTGDKVSFVNEKQEGTVTGYRGKLVIVEIEDGFEIPVAESELVKIISIASKPKAEPETIQKPIADTWKESELISLCEPGTVTVVSLPAATGAVLSGKINYYIVNRSGQELLFVFYAHDENIWKSLNSGAIMTDTVHLLFSRERSTLINISSFLVHGIFNVTESNYTPPVFRKDIPVMVPSLQTADKNISGLLSFAVKSTVYVPAKVSDEEPYNKDLDEGIQELKQLFGKQHPGKPVKQSNIRPGTLINEKEVDLHIEELTDSFAGLSNSDMLQIQLRHFSAEMDAAIKNHFRRIIFIHGVGNGKLKQELRRELKNYKGVTFRDADSRKYGNGATEVILI